MTDEIDYSDIEEQYKIDFPTTYANVVLVDNIPIVDSKRQEKLLSVIKKTFKPCGQFKSDGIFMPMENQSSKGFLFIQFMTDEQAKAALKLDGYKLDKSHTLSVTPFEDIEGFFNMDEEYVEPLLEEFQQKEHLRHWLTDENARDQFCILKGEEVGIYWNNKLELPNKVKAEQRWSDSFVSWSPLGSYLLTVHKQGIALWGGNSWSKINRFAHPLVSAVDFSPNEKYIVTWSQKPFKSIDGQMHVFDILSRIFVYGMY